MCDFCEKKTFLSSKYVDVKIDYDVPFYGTTITINNIKKGCPPYSQCSAKDVNVNVHFQINYCPICGRKISTI